MEEEILEILKTSSPTLAALVAVCCVVYKMFTLNLDKLTNKITVAAQTHQKENEDSREILSTRVAILELSLKQQEVANKECMDRINNLSNLLSSVKEDFAAIRVQLSNLEKILNR